MNATGQFVVAWVRRPSGCRRAGDHRVVDRRPARRVLRHTGEDGGAPADDDGDGITDIATFRPDSYPTPGSAEWFILPSATGQAYRFAFGASGWTDLPVPADFDGDGKADIATFRSDSDLVGRGQ